MAEERALTSAEVLPTRIMRLLRRADRGGSLLLFFLSSVPLLLLLLLFDAV